VPDVQLATVRDTTPDLLRLAAVHAGAVAVPVAVIAAVVLAPVTGSVIVALVVGVVLAVVAGVAVTAVRLRDADDRIVRRIGARPLRDVDHPRLAGLAQNVAMAVGIAEPRLFVVDSPGRNALSWCDARGPVCLAFTTGLLDAADRIELEALLGRQLVIARDGTAEIVTVASALFAPFADGPFAGRVAAVVNRAVDDRSVVRADLDGVRATRYPPGMVAGLELVRAGSTAMAGVPPVLTGLCLAAPVDEPGPFAVHPPLADRIDLLREL
jgi:heat shock protein HtpX